MTEAVANQVILNDVRLARVSLTKPHVRKDTEIDPVTGKPKKCKYCADLILGLNHPQLEAFRALMRAAAIASRPSSSGFRYFFLLTPLLFAARNEMPARMAFC
jgi:hypothetical protein